MPDTITHLIHAAAAGDTASRDQLMKRVYADLLRLARSHLARQAGGGELNAPALVNEAYLRFADSIPGDVASRRVFFQYASRAMQSVIVDQARRRLAAKRGDGIAEVTLATGVDAAQESWTDERIDRLEHALARLERVDLGLHEIVHLRMFAGLTVEQVAEVAGLSPATVKRRWQQAMTILRQTMDEDQAAP